jgi:hypothetical protein
MGTFIDLFALAVGYAVSIYTWPWLRAKWNGVAAEAANLRLKAIRLEQAL